MIDDNSIRHAAEELVARHGKTAAVAARERVDMLSREGNQQRSVDVALRVLTVVEELTGL